MNRVVTAVAGAQVHAADVNSIQDTALGIAQMNGSWVGGRRPSMYSLANSGTVIVIDAVQGLILSGSVLAATGAIQITAGSSGPALSADTWYYVYAFASSGSVAYEYSTSVPDSARVFKSGDTSRRYVGAFRSNHGSNIARFVMNNGDYHYKLSGGNADSFLKVLPGSGGTPSGSDTSATSVPLKDGNGVEYLKPPHAFVVHMRAQLVTSNGTNKVAGIGNPDEATVTTLNMWSITASPLATGGYVESFRTVNASVGQSLSYIVEDASEVLSAWVLGWQE